MFKKDRDVEISSRTLLSKRDTKRLKVDIKRNFPHVCDQDIDSLLPNKVKEMRIKDFHLQFFFLQCLSVSQV